MSVKSVCQSVAVLASAACLLSLGAWARGVASPHLAAPVALAKADQEKLEENTTASLFGELRGGMADYLWMKADRILHSGVEMRGLTQGERRDPNRHQVGHAHGEDGKDPKGHGAGETTVVPNRQADRRGPLGEIERQIKPYMDMRSHRHRDPGDTMSMFRMMTWANPRFIPGWVVGANILAGSLGRPRQAMSFLLEGEKSNPESVEIQVELGRYHLYRFHQEVEAEWRFRKAVAFGLARAESLTEDEVEAWENAHRWLFIQYHREGRRRAAIEIARAALGRFPKSGYFRESLQRPEFLGKVPSS